MMMKTRIAAAAAAACKVWVRSSNPCIFGRSIYENLKTSKQLGYNGGEESTVSGRPERSAISSSYHCDRMLVDLEEREDGSVVLKPSIDGPFAKTSTSSMMDAKSNYHGIPLGRAVDCPTLTPRALQDDKFDRRRRRPFVSLAVVGILVISDGDTRKRKPNGNGENKDTSSSPTHLLITRRPSYMRSFPGAFVFPGGNVDAEDESLPHAISREVMEETGLRIPEDSWKLECLWESIYPTHLPPPVTFEDRSDEHGSAIKAHHLVCYFSAKLSNQTEQQQQNSSTTDSLMLCEEEVDGAVWLTSDNMLDILKATEQLATDDGDKGYNPCDEQTVALRVARNITSHDTRIPLSDLAGIYPRLDKIDGHFCGIAQGSLFALEEFMRRVYGE